MPVEIPLTRRFVALVSPEDAKRVQQHRWCASVRKNGTVYAQMRKGPGAGRIIYMHRFILGFGSGDPFVDHRDHDGLNNQRDNLRPCAHSQNIANQRQRSSRANRFGFRGVFKWGNSFKGTVIAKNQRYWSNVCATPEEAARARDQLALKYHGAFATLNFPDRAPVSA